MKTTKIFSIVSVILLISCSTMLYGYTGGSRPGYGYVNNGIRHEVNVVLSVEIQLGLSYWVMILDGQGREVAPPKMFIPGTSKYVFFERGPVEGARMAVLVTSPYSDRMLFGRSELSTMPAVLFGKFNPGSTYRYDLFPKAQPPK